MTAKIIINNVMDKVFMLTAQWHVSQRRKSIPIPYALHCAEVAKTVAYFGCHDPEVIAAALGHDLLEDTDCTPKLIHKVAGERVLRIIQDLTYKDENPKEHEKDRGCARRKRALDYYKTFSGRPIDSLLVKIADRFCNVHDYVRQGDANYAARYAFRIWPVYESFLTRKAEAEYNLGDEVVTHVIKALVLLQAIMVEHWREDIDLFKIDHEEAERIVVENVK